MFQDNPTLAAGDVIVIKDGVLDGNIDTLPTAVASATRVLVVALSVAEMTADNVTVLFHDAAGAEWCDLVVNVQTTARQIDDLAFPTVSGRSEDVTATGAVGVDWANVEAPTTTVGLSGTTVKAVTDGVVVASHTTAAKAEIQAEAEDALAADDLDHLIQVTAGSEEPSDGTYLDQVMHKSASQTFDATTDSLEALRDRPLVVGTLSGQLTANQLGKGETLEMYRGDNLDQAIVLYDTDGTTPLNITSASVWFTVKDSISDLDDAAAKIQKISTSSSQLEITDGSAGGVTVHLVPSDTAGQTVFGANKKYWYDFQVKLYPSGSVMTPTKGRFIVREEVTKATS